MGKVIEYRFSRQECFCEFFDQIPSIDIDTRNQLVRELDDLAKNFGDDEHSYICRKMSKKIDAVGSSSAMWVRELSRGYNALFKWYKSSIYHEQGWSLLTKYVGASIYYFVKSDDTIPDHIGEMGYVDDAFVFNYTIRSLPSDWCR